MRYIRRTAIVSGLAALTLISVPSSGQNFGRYGVQEYRGRIASPNFTGPGHRYANLRTVIRQAFARGVNYAGHYSIITVGCGADCAMVLIGDIQTGQLLDFPIGGEGYYSLSLTYHSGSRLVLATWNTSVEQEQCEAQQFVLTGTKILPVGQKTVAAGGCHPL